MRLHPKSKPPRKDKAHRRYKVYYMLAYDGGPGKWTGHYRTLTGAKIAAWWNYYVRSFGGTADLTDQQEGIDERQAGDNADD